MDKFHLLELLSLSPQDIESYADVVFVIDGRENMRSLIDKVKRFTQTFHKELDVKLAQRHRKIDNLRVKVIVFRDYSLDGSNALMESRFFSLPEEDQEFHDFVSGVWAGGGGDEPESGLEALALAMRSDFVQEAKRKRHVIILFTNSSAHPSELQRNELSEKLMELYDIWGNSLSLSDASKKSTRISQRAKRLILFAPDAYPWDILEMDLECVIRQDFNNRDDDEGLDLAEIFF